MEQGSVTASAAAVATAASAAVPPAASASSPAAVASGWLLDTMPYRPNTGERLALHGAFSAATEDWKRAGTSPIALSSRRD